VLFRSDASARTRAVTRRLGIKKQQVDQLVACYCPIDCLANTTPAQVHIISDKQGWWYYGQFSAKAASLIYFTDADTDKPATAAALLERARQHQQLAPIIKQACVQTSNFQYCTAYSSALQHCVGERWLAVGDAAASFDPLSSFGITSALSGAFYASQALRYYFHGQPKYLMTYQQLIQKNFIQYLSLRQQEYSKVQGDSAFWQRRSAAA